MVYVSSVAVINLSINDRQPIDHLDFRFKSELFKRNITSAFNYVLIIHDANYQHGKYFKSIAQSPEIFIFVGIS